MKTALCIREQFAPNCTRIDSGLQSMPAIPGFFWANSNDGPGTPVLADRAHCETDEFLLQLLPYITVFNEHNHMLCYSRGGDGGEGRLKGKLSIGFGGHVDTLVPTEYTLYAHLQVEAARELKEEIGVSVDPAAFTFERFIVDRTNPVGRVHLGLATQIMITEQAVGALETGVIEKTLWMSRNELMAPPIFDRLEPWSQMVLRNSR